MQNEKAMELIEKKNASLSEPLAIAENRVKILRYKLLNFKKDQISLKHAKNRLVVLEEQYKQMKENYENLQGEYGKVGIHLPIIPSLLHLHPLIVRLSPLSVCLFCRWNLSVHDCIRHSRILY